jgi:glucokinase
MQKQLPTHTQQLTNILDKTRVFISYSQEDESWAKEIERKLKFYGVKVWRDAVSMIAGNNIHNTLSKEINDADYTVLIISDYSIKSNWVQREINTVLDIENDQNKEILIPIVISNVEIPKFLQDRAYIDGTRVLQPQAINKIIETIVSRSLSRLSELSSYDNRLPSDERLFIGVDVGTTNIVCGLFSLKKTSFSVLWKEKVEHSSIGSQNEVSLMDKIAGQILAVCEHEKVNTSELGGIGVGLPGQVDDNFGWLIFAPGLKQRNVDIVAGLRSRMANANIFIDNDVNCATLAEHQYGRGRMCDNFICVFVGTGVGAGIVIDGQLVRGHNSAAGEIGHMRIDMAEHALQCNCGRIGCLEEYASARAIIRMAKEKIKSFQGVEEVTTKQFVQLVRDGEEDSILIAKQFARNLAIGLGNAVDLLNPKAVVLGGGIIEALMKFDFFRNSLKIGFENSVLSIVKDTPILEATHGNQSGMIGAAVLAYTRVPEADF